MYDVNDKSSQVIVIAEDDRRLALADEEKFAIFLEPIIAKNDFINIQVAKSGQIWKCYLESKAGKHKSHASLIEFDMNNDVEGLASSRKELNPVDAFYNKGMFVSFAALLGILASAYFLNVSALLASFFLPIALGTLAIFTAFTIEKLRKKFI